MSDADNPGLLDDIFDSEKGSESSDVEESVPDMILRAVGSTEAWVDRWIWDAKSQCHFKYDSNEKKLICKNENENLLEYTGEGCFVEMGQKRKFFSEFSPIENCAGILSWGTFLKSELSLVQMEGKLGFSVEGFSEFVAKFDLDESTVRYLAKFDTMLIRYIIARFNPLKAKAKNALQKYVESLLKYPQNWRLKMMSENEILPESLSFIKCAGDWFATRGEIAAHHYWLVDGVRWCDNEPMSVTNGSVIMVVDEGEKKFVPEFMVIIKIV